MERKYSSLNVLNKKSVLDDLEDVDAISQVSAMIAGMGNRSMRREAAKALRKTENITAYADKRATERANKELFDKIEKDMVYFFAVLGIVMYENYHWKETEENDHGQITSLYERLNKKMQFFNEQNMSTEDIVKRLEDMTGIVLIPENHR